VTLSRWARLEELLERAGDIPQAQRAAFVERETGNDPELRAELSTLLEASPGAEEYIGRLRQELLGSGVQGILRDAPSASDAPDPWIGRTVSHYEIRDRLGGGGMGVIYRAYDARLDRLVALKFIAPEIRRDSEVRRRFLREARAASALDHPNICTVHEIAETDDGRLFIVMAAYDGETLRARIERGGGPMPELVALDISEQIARALAAAHERGIVHRDVKPDNVFVTRDGIVKLLDFGLARTADGRMSGKGGGGGTVAYMSPEQARGQPADERSDVWSLGVILFEMLAGVRPFAADDPRTAIDLILTQEPDLRAMRPDLAPGIADIVQRALTKEPARRPAHGREILEGLQQCPRPHGPSPVRRWVPSARTLRVGAAVLGLLLLVTALSLWIRPDRAGDALASVSHVLWVDDNPENNTGVVEQLKNHGVAVTTALSTSDALQRYDPVVHQLIISDMGRYEGAGGAYVGRAGFDLLEGLRARRPDVRIVFCTSPRAVTTYRAEAIAAGALGMVENCEEILRMIGLEPSGQ